MRETVKPWFFFFYQFSKKLVLVFHPLFVTPEQLKGVEVSLGWVHLMNISEV